MSAVMAVGLTQERETNGGVGGERSEESQEGKRKRGGHLGEEAEGRGKPERLGLEPGRLFRRRHSRLVVAHDSAALSEVVSAPVFLSSEQPHL